MNVCMQHVDQTSLQQHFQVLILPACLSVVTVLSRNTCLDDKDGVEAR
jgi:hypothetical protein